ncbi:MAG: tetratricopeptide repeat protein [Desulfobacterales bacterium]
MNLLAGVIFFGSLLITIYLSLNKEVNRKTKIFVWIFFIVICILEVVYLYLQTEEEKNQKSENAYYQNLQERQELRGLGLPRPYIDGLGQSPLLKHFYIAGRNHEKNNNYQDAVTEYKECSAHPKATPSNRVASNILLGNCYYVLSKLNHAEKHYKEALKLSKDVEDKQEMLRGKSAALGNIGVIYQTEGDLDEAMSYYKDSLSISREIGDRKEETKVLGNIELIYKNKNNLDEKS